MLQAVASFDGDAWNAFIKINASNVIFKNFEVDINKQAAIGISIGAHSNPAISGITVDNCLVHDAGDGESDTQLYTYGILVGSPNDTDVINTNITITNTNVYSNYHEGIAIYPSWGTIDNCGNGVSSVLIRGCDIYNNGTDSHPYGSGLGIAINNDSDNVTIEYNTIYDNGLGDGPGQTSGINIRTSGCGSDTTHPNGCPNDLVIRYNLIYGNTADGINNRECFAQSHSVNIYGNIIYNNAGYGFSFNSQDFGSSTYELHNNTFYNNMNGASTFVGCVGLSRDSGTISGTPTITLKNNVFAFFTTSTSLTDYIPAYLDYGSGTLVHENNLYYRSSGETQTYVSVGNWGAHTYYDGEGANAVNASWEATAQTTDPLLVNPTTDFHLQGASPAKAAGVNLGIGYTDYDGASLPSPYGFPVGAYSYNSFGSGSMSFSGNIQ